MRFKEYTTRTTEHQSKCQPHHGLPLRHWQDFAHRFCVFGLVCTALRHLYDSKHYPFTLSLSLITDLLLLLFYHLSRYLHLTHFLSHPQISQDDMLVLNPALPAYTTQISSFTALVAVLDLPGLLILLWSPHLDAYRLRASKLAANRTFERLQRCRRTPIVSDISPSAFCKSLIIQSPWRV